MPLLRRRGIAEQQQVVVVMVVRGQVQQQEQVQAVVQEQVQAGVQVGVVMVQGRVGAPPPVGPEAVAADTAVAGRRTTAVWRSTWCRSSSWQAP